MKFFQSVIVPALIFFFNYRTMKVKSPDDLTGEAKRELGKTEQLSVLSRARAIMIGLTVGSIKSSYQKAVVSLGRAMNVLKGGK